VGGKTPKFYFVLPDLQNFPRFAPEVHRIHDHQHIGGEVQNFPQEVLGRASTFQNREG